MSNQRKLKIAAATALLALGAMGLGAIPSASADDCTVTVTLLTGQTLTFQVNVPPGTPASSLVPPGTGPVKSVSASCSAPTTTTTPPPTTTSTTPTSPGSTSPGPSQTGGGGKKAGSGSKPGGRTGGGSHPKAGSKPGSSPSTTPTPTTGKPTSKPQSPVGAGGIPTPVNPTFSFALPGPAPLGVPNFFIDSFRIPPFLLPIYQAAGIQYDVPWQVLAAINEIETDYGRNLSTSSAGAVGWMQFLPETWKTWGVDATGSGYADPYNPVDAIFAAARYLHAAGASKNLSQAIFAYNHADWYVQSVLLRAKLIGGMPDQLVGALTGLVEGHFPVAAQAKYADDSVTKLAKTKVTAANAAETIGTDSSQGTNIFAKQGSPVIAVNDGKIVKVGTNDKQLGNYVELQDATGNIYTYAHLGSVPKTYPVPKPVRITAGQIAKELSLPSAKPTQAATAGQQGGAPTVKVAKPSSGGSQTVTLPSTAAPPAPQVSDASQADSSAVDQSSPLVKERLFADPHRPGSYAAGGDLQIKNAGPAISSFENYFSDVLHLGRNQYTLKPLQKGAIVVAGTILGRIGPGTPQLAPHVQFLVRPAGKNAPYIDPKPILDGWKLLEATAVYRAAGVNPFFGPGAKNASIGQVLLESKEQLTNRVLADPHVQIYACGRRDIMAGLIDRRVLAVIEFLSGSGLDPTVSGLECGHSLTGSTGVDAAGATGASVDFSKINNIPIKGHQGKGSITDVTVRRLLTLQGTFKPDAIVSLLSYKGQPNTLSLPDHADRIQVSYTPLFGSNKSLSAQVASLLKPGQWIQLINRINNIPEPVVPIAPSKYAIKVPGSG